MVTTDAEGKELSRVGVFLERPEDVVRVALTFDDLDDAAVQRWDGWKSETMHRTGKALPFSVMMKTEVDGTYTLVLRGERRDEAAVREELQGVLQRGSRLE